MVEPSNSQQLQPLQSPSPSFQQQLVQHEPQPSQQMVPAQKRQRVRQPRKQLAQKQNNSGAKSKNLLRVPNSQGSQGNTSMSRRSHLPQNASNNQQNAGIYGQMNFGGMNATQQQIIDFSVNNYNDNQMVQLEHQIGHQSSAMVEPSNSQQWQLLQSQSPSLEHQQAQLRLVQQQQMPSPQMVQAQQQLLQQPNNNSANCNRNINNSVEALQLKPSMSSVNQMQQNSSINSQLGILMQRQNAGIYGKANFGGMSTIQQQNYNVGLSNSNNLMEQQQPHVEQQSELHQQLALQQLLQQPQIEQAQQQMVQSQQQVIQSQQPMGLKQSMQQQMGGRNLSRSALMEQTGHLPGFSGQAAAGQFNLQTQFLTSPLHKPGLPQASLSHAGNTPGQSLQGMQAMGMMNSHNLTSQPRANGTLAYGPQKMTPSQLKKLSQINALTASQGRDITRASFMNANRSGLAQNGQGSMMQNPITQHQRLEPEISSSNSFLRLQQGDLLVQEYLASKGLNPQQSSQVVHQQTQMGNTQVHQQKQQQQQHLFHQQTQMGNTQVHQQQQQQHLFHQQWSPGMVGPASQTIVSLTGSQPDATASATTTPGGSSSHGTEASNQLLGKRKIQDLVSQLDENAKVAPEVEDLLLEIADNFIDSVTAFACTLAKHRKSSTVEAKDVLLHLEKNWKLRIPGFSSEEKKHVPDHAIDVHKRHLDAKHQTKTLDSLIENDTRRNDIS